ncbi:NTP transferase domain-containing protein [Marinicrinis sediminis]|uniref:NTP transferase domain-containing protein n=1 Tax=Marinicrinis sediminis TaxID=1652465 RepID=A0ABW5R7H3_9BACL
MLTGMILAGGRVENSEHVSTESFKASKMKQCIESHLYAMKEVCSEVIVVTDYPQHLLRCFGSSVRIITDFYSHKGPLTAMHAGFSLAKQPLLWVVGYEEEPLHPQAVQRLLEMQKNQHLDAVLPIQKGKVRPLNALYQKKHIDKMITLLEGGIQQVEEYLYFLQTATLEVDQVKPLEYVMEPNGIQAEENVGSK